MPNRTLETEEFLASIPFKPDTVRLKGCTFPCMRVRIPIPPVSLLNWLEKQPLYPKIYFKTSNGEKELAAVGEAYGLDSPPEFLNGSAAVSFYGGMDFQKRRHATWGNVSSSRFILPLFEIEKEKGATYLTVNRTAPSLSNSLSFETTPFSPFLAPIGRLDSPSFPVWKKGVEEALKSEIPKVVLARTSLFTFKETLSPLAYCNALQEKAQNATLFAFLFSKEEAFIGATPEPLYQREGKQLSLAAIAGTRPRGTEFENELLLSKKDQAECRFVADYLLERLKPLCETLSHAQTFQLLKTVAVQHLTIPFSGTLKESVTDSKLIQALHPTPAVAGMPQSKALAFIEKVETFDRGWYAAPIGWISPKSAHLFVAIRSALFRKHELRLFSGAGIVKGSHPSKEWDELEDKIALFIPFIKNKLQKERWDFL